MPPRFSRRRGIIKACTLRGAAPSWRDKDTSVAFGNCRAALASIEEPLLLQRSGGPEGYELTLRARLVGTCTIWWMRRTQEGTSLGLAAAG